MPSPIEIQPAGEDDVQVIAEFNCRLARETEDKTLNMETVCRGVARGLSQPSRCRYFVAKDGDRVVGQVMVTFEWSDWRDCTLWWLQSVYVHHDYRRLGIFAKLFHHVVEQAQAETDVGGIRLYVERENQAAKATYQKLRMRASGHEVYDLPFPR